MLTIVGSRGNLPQALPPRRRKRAAILAAMKGTSSQPRIICTVAYVELVTRNRFDNSASDGSNFRAEPYASRNFASGRKLFEVSLHPCTMTTWRCAGIEGYVFFSYTTARTFAAILMASSI